MTRVIATGTVLLPFTLNICVIGDRVDPLTANVEDAGITITFPASMTEGTVGCRLYPSGYAWWVTDRLYVEASAALAEIGVEAGNIAGIRDILLESAGVAVRRLLNSYRWRFHQPQVHPVVLDPAHFTLEILLADGTRETLPEPAEAFFFNRTPSEPPLDSSVNAETLATLQRDVQDGIEPPHSELLALDLQWLDTIGETRRAAELRRIVELPK